MFYINDFGTHLDLCHEENAAKQNNLDPKIGLKTI